MERKPWRGTWTHRLQPSPWRQLLADYQSAPSSTTSTPLLAALEPAARIVCRTLVPAAGNDPEDLWQQYQLALLQEARRLRPPARADAIPFRLLQRARRSVARWLARQRREGMLPLSPLLASGQDLEAEVVAAVAFRDEPLYRRAVTGEALAAQGRAAGVTAGAMRARAFRRRQRLRALYAGDGR